MNTKSTQIKRALISVSDKTGLLDLAKGLCEQGVEIISTGGTFKALTAAGIPATEISAFTGFPEMMDGRVKTLHPLVHAGILGRRDQDGATAAKHNIQWIDLVVCNLYPFSKTIQKTNVTEDEAIENIDIGGPTMIRAAGKNLGWVTVVVDPNDYSSLLEEMKNGISFATRKRLFVKAVGHTARYDAIIYNYFNQEKFPNSLTLPYDKLYDLRYGENPHQLAAVYGEPNSPETTILNAKIYQGKQLSYNNINDADGALALTKEFKEPACIVVKHANPCGVATGDDITEVFKRAYAADSLSAFGGIISLNRPCNKEIAAEIVKVFAEIVLAPAYEPAALEILASKKNLRVLELGTLTAPKPKREYHFVDGGLLVQDKNVSSISANDLRTVTKKSPTEGEIATMLFGWKVLKHMKSNAILLAKENTTVGLGLGQVSRVDAVDLAIKKAGEGVFGSVLASDAFFPFRDSIDKIAAVRGLDGKPGIRAIIQPGGSIKDQEVIAACDEYGIAMVFTGERCFKH